MNDLQLTTVLETIVAATMASLVFFKLVPMYRVDVFRETMFELRSELFDYAFAGNIRFNDPAYVLLRTLMNGFIRYGHHITVYRTVLTGFHRQLDGGRPHLAWNEKWQKAEAQIQDEEVRHRISCYHSRVVWTVSRHLILGSPILIAALCVLVVCLFAKKGYTSLRTLYQEARNSIMSNLIDPRLLEEEAVYTRLHFS